MKLIEEVLERRAGDGAREVSRSKDIEACLERRRIDGDEGKNEAGESLLLTVKDLCLECRAKIPFRFLGFIESGETIGSERISEVSVTIDNGRRRIFQEESEEGGVGEERLIRPIVNKN